MSPEHGTETEARAFEAAVESILRDRTPPALHAPPSPHPSPHQTETAISQVNIRGRALCLTAAALGNKK